MLLKLLLYTAIIVPVVPCCIGVWKIRHIDSCFKLVLLQAVIALMIDAGVIFLKAGENNIIYYKAFLFFDICISWSILYLLTPNYAQRIAIHILGFLVIVFFLFEVINTPLNSFTKNSFLALCVFVCYGFLSIIVQYYKYPDKHRYYAPVVWVSMGSLYYYCCCIPMFGTQNYLIDDSLGIAEKVYFINDVLKIVRYSFLGVAFSLINSNEHKSINH